MRNVIAGLLAVGMLTLMAGAQELPKCSSAVAPATGDRPAAAPDSVYRLAWQHDEGLCRFVDKGQENWVEVDKLGAVSFRFREARRNCDFVELLDQERGLTVRLYKDALFINGLGGEDWLKYYGGQWVK